MPSHAMDHWLRKKEYIDYETTDLYMHGVTFQSDIQNMFMVEDETIGYFYEDLKRLQDWELLLRVSQKYMYLNLEEIMKDKKFDFISIDGPYGVNDKNGYSRIDILNYFQA